MGPTGSIKRTSKFSNISEPLSGDVHHFYIIPSLAPLTMLDSLFLVIEELYQGSGDPPGPHNGPQNGPCDANFRGPSVKKGPAGSLHGPKSSIFLDRSLDKGQT